MKYVVNVSTRLKDIEERRIKEHDVKIYNTQEEIDADIVDGALKYGGDIMITFDCVVNGTIRAWDVLCKNIKAEDINALNIRAGNINAWNISALDIKAGDISYHGFCIAYSSIRCTSHTGRRDNHIIKALDGEIIIEEKEDKTIVIDGVEYELRRKG